MGRNQVVLEGRLCEVDALRHTPAGIPLLQFKIAHVSQQIEAGGERRVECLVSAMALADAARALAGLPQGAALRVAGFLAQRSRNSTQLVLHVNKIKLIEEET